jgi:hypothetical protein
MPRPAITYADVLTKQLVQDWGDVHHLDAEQSIALHFEQRFGVQAIKVESADDTGEVLILKVVSNLWSAPREFGLSCEGSLIW